LPSILVGDLVTGPTSALDALRDARHRILPSLPDRAAAAALDRALAEASAETARLG
jgi:hypothetical protein